ncbi:MAG TPA: hypothetical protein ENG51_08050 [Deltaproteobacteria bacterium]|nr:hypothetical protein [Deltaproteobacteria bacterium]
MKFMVSNGRRKLTGILVSCILLIWVILLSSIYHRGICADRVGVDQYVSVTTSGERSTLDRVTRILTSTAEVTITNISDKVILFPFHAVININGTSYENVAMPEALGGSGTEPYGKYYYEWADSSTIQVASDFGKDDCSGGCTGDFDKDGDVDGSDLAMASRGGKLGPGQSINFRIKFQRQATINFSYNIQCFGSLSTGNVIPVADAGQDRTYLLGEGQTEISVNLDASGSHDPDGTITQYKWTGIPNPDDVVRPTVVLSEGVHVFTLIVTDNTGAESTPDQVTIVVRRSGAQDVHPPVLSVGETSYTINEGGSPLTIEVSASDPDGDSVVLSAFPKLRNATFSTTPGTYATGTFTFEPDYDQSGIYIVAFKAKDPLGLVDEKVVQITVNNVNRAPVLSVPASVEVDEGSLITIPVKASDPDGELLALSAAPLPANAIFVPSTGSITFAPDFNQAGTYNVECKASDGKEDVTDQIEITVKDVSGGTGEPQQLILNVNPVESPTLLSSARITGTVNTSQTPAARKITSALINSVVPSTAEQGKTLDVVITGQDSGDFATHFEQALSRVSFGEGIMVNSVTVNSSTELVANVTITPDSPVGVRGITVVTNDETAISLVGFNVTRGRTRVTGTVVDPDSGQPLSNALVTIQGTSMSTTTDTNGVFSFSDVPSGNYTLVINTPNHQLIVMDVNPTTGTTVDVGTIETKSLVYDPSSAPSVSLVSVLGRGASNLDCREKRQEIKQMIVDTMLLLGGSGEVGVLDAYGNQLHPEVTGNGVLSLSDEGADFIAMKMQRDEIYSLADLLEGVSEAFEWGGDGVALTLLEWLNGLQELVNQAWADPTNPENLPLLVIFNQGNSLTLEAPKLKPYTRLNALQAFLFCTGLYGAMEYVKPPDNTGLLQRTIHFASDFLIRNAYAGPATSCINRSKYNRYWRGFFDTRSSWPLTRLRGDISKLNFAIGFITATAVSSASVVGPLVGTMLYGTMVPDMAAVFSTAWSMAHIPEPPKIIQAKLNKVTGQVEVLFKPSPSEQEGYDWLYTLCYFESPDSPPTFKTAYQIGGWALEDLGSGERLIFDDEPPEKGTGYYAMTVTRQPEHSRTLEGPILPFWAIAHGSAVTDEYLWHIRTTRGITSDWSDPFLYSTEEGPEIENIDALYVHTSGYSRFAFVSDTRNGAIWIHRLDSPSGEDETHATFNSWTGLDTSKGLAPVWHIDVGFKEPGQKGLAMDDQENLYTENSASDMLFGGRIFKFPLEGGKIFVGSINYFSRMLSFAHPTSAGPMDFGPEPEHLDTTKPEYLYIWDNLAGSVKAVPVHEENDPFHRVGHVFVSSISDHGPVIDMQWQNKRLFLLQSDRIVEVIRQQNPTTGTWETVSVFHQIYPDPASSFMPGGLAVCPCLDNLPDFCEDQERRFLITDNTNGRVLQVKTSVSGEFVDSIALLEGLDHPGDIDLGSDGTVFALVNGNSVRHYYTGLTGKVVDLDGNPLGGAKVTISGDMLKEIVTTTNAEGIFSAFDLTKPPRSDDTVVVTISYNGETMQRALFLEQNCQGYRTIVFDPEPEKGILSVDIQPPEIASEAMWSIGSGGQNLQSNMSLSVAPGRYHVSFTPVEGWITPDDVWVPIEPGSQVRVRVEYRK